MHDEGKAMTMVDHNESVLGDNPTDEDKLGFTEPAARLADKIARFPADTPMVVTTAKLAKNHTPRNLPLR